jgi:hypothetical protein
LEHLGKIMQQKLFQSYPYLAPPPAPAANPGQTLPWLQQPQQPASVGDTLFNFVSSPGTLELGAALLAAGQEGKNTGAGLGIGLESYRAAQQARAQQNAQALDYAVKQADYQAKAVERSRSEQLREQLRQEAIRQGIPEAIGLSNPETLYQKYAALTPYQKAALSLEREKLQQDASLAREKLQKELAAMFNAPAIEGMKKQAEETAKADVESQVQRRTNVEGAKSFLAKVNSLESDLRALGSGSGPYEGGGINQYLGKLFGTESSTLRSSIDQKIKDLELDIAKMDLKGQGAITESERAIARGKLPQLTNNPDANKIIIQTLRNQAQQLIKNDGRAPDPTMPTLPSTPIPGAGRPPLSSFMR